MHLRQSATLFPTGKAKGWFVDAATVGWKWCAFGPRGSEWGLVDSYNEAERMARVTCDRLTTPSNGGAQ